MQAIRGVGDFAEQRQRFMNGIPALSHAFATYQAHASHAPTIDMFVQAASEQADAFVARSRTSTSTFDQEMILWQRSFLSRLTFMLGTGRLTPDQHETPTSEGFQEERIKTQSSRRRSGGPSRAELVQVAPTEFVLRVTGRGGDAPASSTTAKAPPAVTPDASCGTICQARQKVTNTAKAALRSALERSINTLFGEARALFNELGKDEFRKWAVQLCDDLGFKVPNTLNLTDLTQLTSVLLTNIPNVIVRVTDPPGTIKILQQGVLRGADITKQMVIKRVTLRFEQKLTDPAVQSQMRAAAQVFGVKSDDKDARDVLKRLTPVLMKLAKEEITSSSMLALVPKLVKLAQATR